MASGTVPQWELEAATQTLRVTEDNVTDLSPFVPTEIGHCVWMKVRSTWKGVCCEATIYDYCEGFERREDATNGRPLNPTSAVRLIQEIDGFDNDALRHLSLKATHHIGKLKALSGANKSPSAGALASAATGGSSPAVPVPAQVFNDQSLLSRLEDFIDSAAFSTPLERFAAEHAHKFKPLGPGDEHPLQYQELYLQFESVLEEALEAFLRGSGASVAELVRVVARAKDRGDPLRCIDVLLASSEYAAFLELMMDYKFSMYIAGREVTPDSVVSQVHVSAVSPDRLAPASQPSD